MSSIQFWKVYSNSLKQSIAPLASYLMISRVLLPSPAFEWGLEKSASRSARQQSAVFDHTVPKACSTETGKRGLRQQKYQRRYRVYWWCWKLHLAGCLRSWQRASLRWSWFLGQMSWRATRNQAIAFSCLQRFCFFVLRQQKSGLWSSSRSFHQECKFSSLLFSPTRSHARMRARFANSIKYLRSLGSVHSDGHAVHSEWMIG